MLIRGRVSHADLPVRQHCHLQQPGMDVHAFKLLSRQQISPARLFMLEHVLFIVGQERGAFGERHDAAAAECSLQGHPQAASQSEICRRGGHR